MQVGYNQVAVVSTAPNPYTGASPGIFRGSEASKCAKTAAVVNHAIAF